MLVEYIQAVLISFGVATALSLSVTGPLALVKKSLRRLLGDNVTS